MYQGTTYRGVVSGGEAQVFVDNLLYVQPLDPRTDLRNHSPTGFAWGFHGSGPAQLALAILCCHLSGKSTAELQQLAAKAQVTLSEVPPKPYETLAMALYPRFKVAVIGKLPQDKPFALTTEQIDAALDRILWGTSDEKLQLAVSALKKIADFGHASGCGSSAPVYENSQTALAKEALDKLGEQ